MLKRVGVFIGGLWALVVLQGCVSIDTYRMKELEVQSLYSANEDMQARNKSLRAEKAGLEIRVHDMDKENKELEYRVEKQNRQIGFLKSWAEGLEKDGDGLRAQMQKLNGKIAELDKENQRLFTMSLPQNLLRSLGDRIEDLQMKAELLSVENENLKSRQIIFRTEEKKPTGAEPVKTVEPAEGKPQSVMVTSGVVGSEK